MTKNDALEVYVATPRELYEANRVVGTLDLQCDFKECEVLEIHIENCQRYRRMAIEMRGQLAPEERNHELTQDEEKFFAPWWKEKVALLQTIQHNQRPQPVRKEVELFALRDPAQSLGIVSASPYGVKILELIGA